MPDPAPRKTTLGTFGGVFTPSVLTILGIILFRRAGYVVGSAGLGTALIIIVMANCISVLTAFSLAAISTNLKVKGGGDYYLISRTLGLEFGGAIGIVLFLAQSVSIAFYSIGFGEAVAELIPWTHPLMPRFIAAAAVLLLFIFAWLGADWATRLQYLVMTILGLGILSFFIGGWLQFQTETFTANWTAPADGDGFWFLFALFFPAVTGFTQGVSMSGDLKDPGRSLPAGTFLAVGVSILVYIGSALLFAGAQTGMNLMADYNAMRQIAIVSGLISAGVIAACLSSGMASFLGAPRILQAMASDRILPRIQYFARGEGETNNPRRGVLLSLAIALATVALGNLNAIAPVVSMFFLTSYGLLNYSTWYEARAASPSFRPRFRWFNKHLSLLGALGCLGAMLAIQPVAGIVSISILVAIYQYLKRRDTPARWSHGRRSYNFQRIRELLLEMDNEPAHPRDWRPQILAFSSDEHRRLDLLRFASWIEGDSGMTSVISIIHGVGSAARRDAEHAGKSLKDSIADSDYHAFPRVLTAPDFRTGLRILLQSYGVGPIAANILLFNWLDERPFTDPERAERMFGSNLREALRMKTNIVVLATGSDAWSRFEATGESERRIDVWWGGGATSRLCLLLAYLMTRTPDWDRSTLRVLAQGDRKHPEQTLNTLNEMLDEVRIHADADIVENIHIDTLTEKSGNASLVFIPMMLQGTQPVTFNGVAIEDALENLPVTALVTAAEDIALDAAPEDGDAGEHAALADRAADLKAAAEKADKALDSAIEAVRKATDAVLAMESNGSATDDPGAYKAAKQGVRDAEATVRKCRDKAQAARDAALAADKKLD